MDLAVILYWLSLTFLAGIFLNTRIRRGLALVTGCVLVVAPALLLIVPAEAPWVVLGLWIVLVLMPGGLSTAAAARGLRNGYAAAWLLARPAALLHPFDDLPATAKLYRALLLEQQGRRVAAHKLFGVVAARSSVVGLNAQVFLARWDDDFAPLLQDPRLVRADPTSLALRLRVLGETGRLSEMLDVVVAASMQQAGAVGTLAVMYVLTFCGRPANIAALCARSAPGGAFAKVELWVATAQLAAGGRQEDIGRASLAELARSTDVVLRHLAERRLHRPPALAAERLRPLDLQRLAKVEQTAGEMLEPAPRARRSPAYVTLSVLVVNLLVFAAEIYAGGSNNDEVLYRLGALYVPDVVDQGAWWRLVSPLFLHAGPIHLATNMLGLLVLGSFIEPLFGRWRFALVYLAAGCGSNAVILLLSHLGMIQNELLVGASGAIMGLVGALGAAALRQWLAARSIASLGRVVRIMLALGLQTAIDLTTPRVSVAAHLGGAGIGLILGAILGLRWTGPEAAATGGRHRPAVPDDAPASRRLLRYVIAGGSLGASLLIAAYR